MNDKKPGEFSQADAFATSRFSLAQVVFGLVTFVVALVLMSQIGTQAKFFGNLALEKQPGLWPLIAIAGMLVFGFFQIMQYWFHRHMLSEPTFAKEAVVWLKALEYAGWFMVYVALVPVTGYLPTTLVFVSVLTVRLGYGNGRMIAIANLCGVAVVLLFKSFLQVKIPGGLVYDYLPAGLRNFMIVYF